MRHTVFKFANIDEHFWGPRCIFAPIPTHSALSKLLFNYAMSIYALAHITIDTYRCSPPHTAKYKKCTTSSFIQLVEQSAAEN